MSSPRITLHEWAAARMSPPPPRKRLQRWARDGWIYPMPEKIGRDYYVEHNAVFIGRDPEKAAQYYESEAT